MAFTYPICLNLKNKKCIVVGAGEVAVRKINTLLKQEALVTVISPDLHPNLKEKLALEQFIWLNTSYQNDMLENAFLVIAATNNRAVNHQIAEYCNQNNILVNVIDEPQESSFIVNSYFTKGDLLVAVSTGGASPALSRKIRIDLEKSIPDEYAEVLEIVAWARAEALDKIKDSQKRREFLQNLAEIDYITLLENESIATLKDRVKECLLSYLE